MTWFIIERKGRYITVSSDWLLGHPLRRYERIIEELSLESDANTRSTQLNIISQVMNYKEEDI